MAIILSQISFLSVQYQIKDKETCSETINILQLIMPSVTQHYPVYFHSKPRSVMNLINITLLTTVNASKQSTQRNDRVQFTACGAFNTARSFSTAADVDFVFLNR